ncbi:MAG: hypothetical protein ACTSQY_00430 [Candidatus Odinarchaeia archaeon]|nr:MAG: hypothetical protein [Lokiarchaeota virus Fenrir Meg22_1012]URC17267.1 MAG: hypothetical protein [Lokiarchaeota virus Fenrir Meg22_1214]
MSDKKYWVEKFKNLSSEAQYEVKRELLCIVSFDGVKLSDEAWKFFEDFYELIENINDKKE